MCVRLHSLAVQANSLPPFLHFPVQVFTDTDIKLTQAALCDNHRDDSQIAVDPDYFRNRISLYMVMSFPPSDL